MFGSYQSARDVAAAIKWQALENLEAMLLEFEKNATANGINVHWAPDAPSVCNRVLDIMKAAGAKRVIKSKSMATEEVHLKRRADRCGARGDRKRSRRVHSAASR